nr:hypothetical protein CFP56_30683 [Quercus suber]
MQYRDFGTAMGAKSKRQKSAGVSGGYQGDRCAVMLMTANNITRGMTTTDDDHHVLHLVIQVSPSRILVLLVRHEDKKAIHLNGTTLALFGPCSLQAWLLTRISGLRVCLVHACMALETRLTKYVTCSQALMSIGVKCFPLVSLSPDYAQPFALF